MVGIGEPVYNTDQRRQILRQMKQYFDEEWLKKKAAGKLGKRIRLPNSKKRRPYRKRKKYNKIKIKIVKRKRRKRRRRK